VIQTISRINLTATWACNVCHNSCNLEFYFTLQQSNKSSSNLSLLQKKPYEKSELHAIPEISQPLSSNLSLLKKTNDLN